MKEIQVKMKVKYLKVLKQSESVNLKNVQGSPELLGLKTFLFFSFSCRLHLAIVIGESRCQHALESILSPQQ